MTGGWLIVSPAETSNDLFAPLTPVQLSGALVYRNAAGASPRPAVFETSTPRQRALVAPEPAAPPAELPPAATAAEPACAPAPTPDYPGAYARAARLCAGEGRLGEAIGWCEKAIAADRLNPAHYYLLATIQQEQGLIDAAIQSLTRTLYLDPEFALAHFALGNLRVSQGRCAEAERHFANTLAVLGAHDEILPEADGLTAGRLVEIIASTRASRPRTAS
jgi:chemotaxis protein methyltransferase CheR